MEGGLYWQMDNWHTSNPIELVELILYWSCKTIYEELDCHA